MRVLTATFAALALAAPAHAARSVPHGFYGLSYDGALRQAPADVQDAAWGRMAVNGAESARAVFSWATAQPGEDGAFDHGMSDLVVGNAAAHGIELLPIVSETPIWARARRADWWPAQAADFGAYVTALVLRYGPDGSFWADNPSLPKRPIRYWQIYNEPGRSVHYTPLLRAAYRSAKQADPGAKIVLAGLTGFPGGGPWDVLRFQYRHGVRRWFDVAAMHLYTGRATNLDDGVRLFRRVMKRHGDGGKPMWLTEFGITASKGRTTAPDYQRTLRTTDKGQAAFLDKAYRLLALKHAALNLARAYWYTWASSYKRGTDIFNFAGLNSYAGGALEARPSLRSYRASARRDEGCRKTAAGRCK